MPLRIGYPVLLSTRRWFAYTCLAIAVFGITWSAMFVRWAAVSGPASAFYRVLIAGVVLVPWRLMRRDLPAPPRRAAWLAVLGGVFFGFDLLFYNTALLETSAATAVLLANTAPVIVGIGTWLVFRRRPRAAFWSGLALALAGCAAIMMADAAAGDRASAGNLSGDLLALTAAIFWALYLMTTERVRADLDTLTFSALSIVGSVATLLVLCLALRVPLAGYSTRSWASLAGLGLVSQLAAYFAIAYALGHLPATIMSVGLLAQFPLTAIVAVPLLGEPLTVAEIAGGLFVLAGIYVVTRAPKGAVRQRA
jgi:drug/metabolite transporter (DMT)-like permease